MGLCIFWAIWKRINDVVFNKKTLKVQKVIQEALYWYNMKIEVNMDEVQPTESDILELKEITGNHQKE